MSVYHDAELKAVDCSSTSSISLVFLLADGFRKVLTLQGAQFFRINDFMIQNVVSRLYIFSGKDIDEAFVSEKLRWASSQHDSESFLKLDILNELVQKIRLGERSLLVVEPSWGAEVVILFEDIAP